MNDATDLTLPDRGQALDELTRARVALGAMLSANAMARSKGQPEPGDDAALTALTDSVVRAYRAAHDAATKDDTMLTEVLTFIVEESDGHGGIVTKTVTVPHQPN